VPPADQPEGPRRRPRFTGRAAILVLVLAVLTVSYASSMRAYLQQRAHIQDLKAQIAERESDIDNLEREKRRYEDPAYVRAQARERFGYVMPGETSYVVLDENGDPLQSESSLSDPSSVIHQAPKAWWGDAWESVQLAGNPPNVPPPPLTQIDGSDEPTGSG
jgi:cell division protein FtsB